MRCSRSCAAPWRAPWTPTPGETSPGMVSTRRPGPSWRSYLDRARWCGWPTTPPKAASGSRCLACGRGEPTSPMSACYRSTEATATPTSCCWRPATSLSRVGHRDRGRHRCGQRTDGGGVRALRVRGGRPADGACLSQRTGQLRGRLVSTTFRLRVEKPSSTRCWPGRFSLLTSAGRPASAFLTCRVMAGGMTERMTVQQRNDMDWPLSSPDSFQPRTS